MNVDPTNDNDPEHLSTRIDGVDARLLVHIERLEPVAAPADSPNEGSPEDTSITGIVTDAHPRAGGESEK